MKFAEAILFAIIHAVMTVGFARGQSSVPVAFSAARTTDMTNVAMDVPVEFDVIDVDVGNSFSADLGLFTAPADGIYFFSFSVKSSDATVHLKVNLGGGEFVWRSTTFTDTTANNDENMASGTGALVLDTGDTVQFFLSQFGNRGIINTSNVTGIYTSFSGMLVQDFISSMNAFDVSKEGIDDDNVVAPTPVAFDTTWMDIGSCFSSDTFQADYTDVYLFSFMSKGDRMSIHLDDGESNKRSAIRCNTNGMEENAASNTVILPVNVGTSFKLMQGSWGDNLDNTSPSGGICTSFTGFKLFDPNLTNWYAFSATRTVNMADVSADTIIQFDKIDYNKGAAFSVDGKTFVAPRLGYYFFTFTIKSSVAAVHLKHTSSIGIATTRRSAITTTPGCTENTVQNSVVLQLEVGDEVELYLSPYGDVGLVETMEPNTAGVFTSFSGMLLYAV